MSENWNGEPVDFFLEDGDNMFMGAGVNEQIFIY